MGKGNGQMVGGRYHFIMVRSFDFILGNTAALWKDIRFTSERHLRSIVGGQKIIVIIMQNRHTTRMKIRGSVVS